MGPLLHSTTQRQLEGAQANPGGYIFYGSQSVGKYTTALEVTRRLNCLDGEASANCVHCEQLKSGNFPDLIIVRPEEKQSISVDQIRDLSKSLSLSAYGSAAIRVVIIDAADKLTQAAQNALLKLLEEPPERTKFILVARELMSLLPTVQSRLGRVYFAPVGTSEVEAYLVERYHVKPDFAHELAEASMGFVGLAINLMRENKTVDDESDLALAERILKEDIFARFMWVKSIADQDIDFSTFMSRLDKVIRGELLYGKQDSRATARRLEAVHAYYVQIAANVSRRVALERLMVEL